MDSTQEDLRHVVMPALRLRQDGNDDSMRQFPPGFLEETRAPQILIGNITVQFIGTMFFAARVYSRLYLTRSWKIEDWVLLASWVIALGWSSCQYGQVAHGTGRHAAAAKSRNDPIESQKYAFTAQVLVLQAIALPKMSICLSYLRIFYSDKTGRRLIQVLMAILVGAMVPCTIEFFFQCKPLHVYWTELRPNGKCLDDIATFYVTGSLNVLVDLALISILIPRVLGLKLNSRQKGALIGIMALGLVAAAADLTRMVRVGTTLAKVKLGTFDPPWDQYDVSIWTSTEIYVSIICAAAPGIKPLISKMLPHILGTTAHTQTRSRITGATGTTAIELSSKFKRSTMGTATSATVFSNPKGQYAEFGRGVDEESLGEESFHEQHIHENRIMKKSEITIHTSDR